MATPLKTFQLRPPKAPNLPIAPVDYTQTYQDQVLNALRLYFNQIDNLFSTLLGITGASTLRSPNGSFYLTTQQTIPVTNTAYAVPFTNTLESNYVEIGSTTSHIITRVAGYYNFQFSAQLAKTSGSTVNIWIWARLNGLDVDDSNTKIQLTGSSSAESVAAWNFVFSMQANDYFELMWASDSTNAILKAEVPNAFSPAIPPVILTTTFVSALYS